MSAINKIDGSLSLQKPLSPLTDILSAEMFLINLRLNQSGLRIFAKNESWSVKMPKESKVGMKQFNADLKEYI